MVNAFLDGSIEKETYLTKKDEPITAKTDLQQRKSDFGRKGNNWIEPLREWILTAHHAEKLASSKEFDEIKSFVEKIGTNRHLFGKNIFLDFKKPFDLLANRSADERSEEAASLSNLTNLVWSQILNLARTNFERNAAGVSQ